MTIENDLDRPFNTSRAMEKTQEQSILDDPEEEDIDPDDELEDELTDSDDADQMDDEDEEDDEYRDSPRAPPTSYLWQCKSFIAAPA